MASQLRNEYGLLQVLGMGAVLIVGSSWSDAQTHEFPSDTSAERAPVLQSESRPVRLTLRGNYQHEFDTDIEGSDASFDVNRFGGGLGAAFTLSDKLTLRTGFDYSYNDYSFDNADTLIPGVTGNDPFDAFHTVALVGGLDYRLDENWTISGTGFVRYEGEDGVDLDDALIGGGLGFFTYRFNEDLTLGFGLGVTSRLEDDAWVVPYLFVQWQIDEQWQLRSDGLGARLSWSPSQEYEVFLRGRFVRDEWRLDDDRGTASEGVFRDDRIPVGLGIDWRPMASLTITGEVSVMVYRELEFLNDSGRSVSKEEIDEVMPAVGIRVVWSF